MIRTGIRSAKEIAPLCRRSFATEAGSAAIPTTPKEIVDELQTPKKSSQSGGNDGYTSKAPENRRTSDLLTARIEQQYLDRNKPNYNKFYLHCLTSHSNTLLTLTNYKHEPIMWTSAGLCGFKKAARGGYEAGFRSTTMMLEKMKLKEEEDVALELKSRNEPQRVQKTQLRKQKPIFRPTQIELVIKDFGLGREAVMKALMGVEGDHYRNKITNIIDATPLKFGGVRARAVRRL